MVKKTREPRASYQPECIEMHCERRDKSHRTGDQGCSWIILRDGTMISRREFNETSVRPDRIGRPFGESGSRGVNL